MQAVSANCESRGASGKPAVLRLFELMAGNLAAFLDESRRGPFAPRWLRFGSLDGGLVRDLVRDAERDYPIELRSPFEGVDTIAGGLWLGRELAGRGRADGIAKLRFGAGTLDLPVHAHEHSDRLIVVLAGTGFFHVSNEPLAGFTGDDVRHIAVCLGDVLVFPRDLLHTFSAPNEALILLSYHSPVIAFDDQRQYTVPGKTWRPRDERADVRYA